MPGTISDGPTVALSFANNFWGKDDSGVDPLLSRMHNAKQTCDELKAFYTGLFTRRHPFALADNTLQLALQSKKSMPANFYNCHESHWDPKRPAHFELL